MLEVREHDLLIYIEHPTRIVDVLDQFLEVLPNLVLDLLLGWLLLLALPLEVPSQYEVMLVGPQELVMLIAQLVHRRLVPLDVVMLVHLPVHGILWRSFHIIIIINI
jgi:hypothetical protein